MFHLDAEPVVFEILVVAVAWDVRVIVDGRIWFLGFVSDVNFGFRDSGHGHGHGLGHDGNCLGIELQFLAFSQ